MIKESLKTQKDFRNKDLIQKRIFLTVMMIVPVLNFLIFWVYVNFNSILFAFQNVDSLGTVFFTFKNFERIFELFSAGSNNLLLQESLTNTLKIWCFKTFLMFPLGIFWTYFLYKKIFMHKFFRFMFYVPAIISSVALTAIFKYLIEPDGPAGQLYAMMLNLERVPSFLTQQEYAMNTVLVYMFWTGFCTNLVLLSGAMARIDDSLIEAGLMDGITMSRELFSIVLPLIWPTLSTLIVFDLASIFTSDGPILLLTEGEAGTYTLGYWIFDQVNQYKSYYVPSALGLIFTLIGFPLILIVKTLMDKVYADVEF